MRGSRLCKGKLTFSPGTGQGQLTLAELTVVEVPWLPVDEPVSL